MTTVPPRDPASAVRNLDPARYPLVLSPSGPRGWFGGESVVTADPAIAIDACSHERALQLLALAFDAQTPALAAAVLPYDGPARVCVYPGGWLRNAAGWTPWGTPPELPGPEAPVDRARGPLLRDVSSGMEERGFRDAVCRAQEAIRDGDVYVLNLTYLLRGTPVSPVGAAFERLTARTPAPMAALLAGPDGGLASVSPERFVSAVRGSDGSVRVAIEPIKGTAPRHEDPSRDAALARGIAESDKERAEHIMIVDLERNDLGRVCEPGSILVDPLLGVFATPYCHQMVSKVSGRLRADAGGVVGLLEAAFPCGSVTGAPKIAAMRLIAELESGPRGAYTGSLVVAMPGRLDSSVLIRTLEYRGEAAQWGTGCGITIDSDPAAEWRESVLKTTPLRG